MKKRQGRAPMAAPIDHLRGNFARLKAEAAWTAAPEEQEACGREAAQDVVRFLRTDPTWVGSGAVFRIAGLLDGFAPSEDGERRFWIGFFGVLEHAIRGS